MEPPVNVDMTTPRALSGDTTGESFNTSATKQGFNWWDKDETTAQTPVATTFYQVDQAGTTDGFNSPMDRNGGLYTPAAASSYSASRETDEEDLGFGNSKPGVEKPKLINTPQPVDTKATMGVTTSSTSEPPGKNGLLIVLAQVAHFSGKP